MKLLHTGNNFCIIFAMKSARHSHNLRNLHGPTSTPIYSMSGGQMVRCTCLSKLWELCNIPFKVVGPFCYVIHKKNLFLQYSILHLLTVITFSSANNMLFIGFNNPAITQIKGYLFWLFWQDFKAEITICFIKHQGIYSLKNVIQKLWNFIVGHKRGFSFSTVWFGSDHKSNN